MASYEDIAKALAEAYESKNAIVPPRETLPELDLNGAYRIQQLQEDMRTAAGERIVGRKIGLTSLAMQEQLGVDSPDFGFFTDSQVFEDGAGIPVSRFLSPKVEPELGFRLAKDLGSDATMDEVIDALEGTYLAVEIIDSRVANWDIKLVDTVADNASCGAVIVSSSPVEVSPSDLPRVKAEMLIDDELAGEGTGAAVMGHPLEPLVWLAHTLGEQGVQLKAGELILTGSFCGAAAVNAGSKVVVDYGELGQLSATFN